MHVQLTKYGAYRTIQYNIGCKPKLTIQNMLGSTPTVKEAYNESIIVYFWINSKVHKSKDNRTYAIRHALKPNNNLDHCLVWKWETLSSFLLTMAVWVSFKSLSWTQFIMNMETLGVMRAVRRGHTLTGEAGWGWISFPSHSSMTDMVANSTLGEIPGKQIDLLISISLLSTIMMKMLTEIIGFYFLSGEKLGNTI